MGKGANATLAGEVVKSVITKNIRAIFTSSPTSPVGFA